MGRTCLILLTPWNHIEVWGIEAVKNNGIPRIFSKTNTSAVL